MKVSREFREKYPGVEIKRLGHQLVAPGSLHPSGKRYVWDMLATDMGEEGPPPVPAKLWKALQAAHNPSLPDKATGTHTPEQIAAMLKYLDAENYRNREEWLTIMMACHHASGGAARQEFIDWSTTDDWYAGDSESIGETWDSLSVKGNGGKPVTIATLYAELHKYDHGDKVIQGDATQDFENVEDVDAKSGQARIQELAALSPVEYERIRAEEAERLGLRKSFLDKEVAKLQEMKTLQKASRNLFEKVVPHADEVDGAELLDEITEFIQRFIICDERVAEAVTLWIAFTWFIDQVQVAPLLIITAPEKRCGKSQLLTIVSKLCRKPLIASNLSTASIFRVMELHGPTLLVDEFDTFLKQNDEARGIINSGHTRQTAFVLRLVGDDHELMQFSTWGAKALSGIGHLQDTLMDRAIIVELRRKLPHEKVDRIRHAKAKDFKILRSKLARYAADSATAVEEARPDLPENLNDRAQDNWEPLIAIADHAGGEWPKIVRRTATYISADKDSLSLSTELLKDIKRILKNSRYSKKILSDELIRELTNDHDGPWEHYKYNRGAAITPRQVARLLAAYGIKSKVIRGGNYTKRGYSTADFMDAFERYLPSEDED
jgi:putative DNA primase/helicase